jgi:hypothetical protein
MAILAICSPAAMSLEQCDAVMRRLAAGEAGAPSGRLIHLAAWSGVSLRLVEVYESQRAFEDFGLALLPVLREMGIGLTLPEIAELHNSIVVGAPARRPG